MLVHWNKQNHTNSKARLSLLNNQLKKAKDDMAIGDSNVIKPPEDLAREYRREE